MYDDNDDDDDDVRLGGRERDDVFVFGWFCLLLLRRTVARITDK